MARAARKPGKTRFTLWLPDLTHEKLSKLQQETGKDAVADVIRDAIEVYDSLRQASAQGVDLYFENRKSGSKGRIWLLPGPPPS
jgi:hypothetical protein